MPLQLQHYDVEKVFPNTEFEENIEPPLFLDVIDVLEKSDLCLLIIKTANDAVFGAFLARGLVKNNKSYVGHS